MKTLIALAVVLTTIAASAQEGWVKRHEEVVWAVTHGASAAADMTTTIRTLNSCPGCREVNPLLGRRPGTARVVVTGAGITAGFGLLAHQAFKHGHPGWGRVLHGEGIAVHGTCAVLNGKNIH